MSKNQLKELLSLGHSVGSHTYDHPWLDKLSNEEVIIYLKDNRDLDARFWIQKALLNKNFRNNSF